MAIPLGDTRHLGTICSALTLLYRRLSRQRVDVFCTTLGGGTNFYCEDRSPRDAAEQMVTTLAHHFGVDRNPLTFDFSDDVGGPGQVRRTGDRYHILVNTVYRQQHRKVASILAHELSHVFLDHSGLRQDELGSTRFADRDAYEVLTDVTAFYLGLGPVILNSFEVQVPWAAGGPVRGQWFGYISPAEMGYVIAKRSLYFGDDPSAKLSTETARMALEYGLRLAREDQSIPPYASAGFWDGVRYRRNRRKAADVQFKVSHGGYAFEDRGLRVTFACWACMQTLRVPAGKRRISVKCPTCTIAHDCST